MQGICLKETSVLVFTNNTLQHNAKNSVILRGCPRKYQRDRVSQWEITFVKLFAIGVEVGDGEKVIKEIFRHFPCQKKGIACIKYLNPTPEYLIVQQTCPCIYGGGPGSGIAHATKTQKQNRSH